MKGVRSARSAAHLAADHRPEALPACAVEFLHLQLLERVEAGRRGVDGDARQQHVEVDLQIGGLLHDVLAREVITALFEHLHERLPD